MFKILSFLARYHRNCVLEIRSLHSAIPSSPVVQVAQKNNTKTTAVDEDTVNHLERLSLVDFANARGIQRLEEAVQLANKLSAVDTTNVEPMYSVLEDKTLYLREDKVSDGGYRKDVMANAAVTEEEYFVAPPGNIPLSPRENTYTDN